MENKELEKKIAKLLEEVAALRLENVELEKRIKNLEEGSIGTGVYLDGVPEFAQEYISKPSKKVGE